MEPGGAPVPAPPSLGALTRASFMIGCLGFGGPAGQIALMHRVFVEEKRWIDESRYLHALSYCTLLPGPEAQQLATYVGWLLHGVRGGLIAGTLFVLPGAVVLLGLAFAYVAFGTHPAAAGALLGLKAVVLAFVAEAIVKIGRRALKTRGALAIAAAALLALGLFHIPFPIVIVAAAVFGALALRPAQAAASPVPPAKRSIGSALAAAGTCLAAWLAPPLTALAVLGPEHVLTRVGLLFSQLAVVTFGGAYAVLAYLQQQAVVVEGWLSPPQMIDGLGLAETTPGPLVLVNQFVGFLAGWQADGGGVWLALLAAGMASWCTFAPSFLWIFAGAPFSEALRANSRASGALAAITAAVLGIVTQLGLWFSLQVLFAKQHAWIAPWGASLQTPDLSSFQLAPAVIALLATIALIRLKWNPLVVVGLGLAAGLLLQFL